MTHNAARALPQYSNKATKLSQRDHDSDGRPADRQAVNLSIVPNRQYPRLIGEAAVIDAMRRTG